MSVDGRDPTEKTTIQISVGTHRRLEELKPYESVSFGEIVAEMVDMYEARGQEDPR